eukprot:TRINITY_DN4042_c0_g2_i1.p1 TRINITY_DN4042_c0_g2~~TRINITY_DN4042_c0_g2_i1.p1  ORF type:complete len:1238 (-),score=276.58 TRINITY_DN4042_c0_g2_i1:209-3922(-)
MSLLWLALSLPFILRTAAETDIRAISHARETRKREVSRRLMRAEGRKHVALAIDAEGAPLPAAAHPSIGDWPSMLSVVSEDDMSSQRVESSSKRLAVDPSSTTAETGWWVPLQHEERSTTAELGWWVPRWHVDTTAAPAGTADSAATTGPAEQPQAAAVSAPTGEPSQHEQAPTEKPAEQQQQQQQRWKFSFGAEPTDVPAQQQPSGDTSTTEAPAEAEEEVSSPIKFDFGGNSSDLAAATADPPLEGHTILDGDMDSPPVETGSEAGTTLPAEVTSAESAPPSTSIEAEETAAATDANVSSSGSVRPPNAGSSGPVAASGTVAPKSAGTMPPKDSATGPSMDDAQEESEDSEGTTPWPEPKPMPHASKISPHAAKKMPLENSTAPSEEAANSSGSPDADGIWMSGGSARPKVQASMDFYCEGNVQCPLEAVLRHNAAAITCSSPHCVSAEDILRCCARRAFCTTLSCPFSHALKKTANNTLCVDAVCVQADAELCCEKRAMCSALETCGETHVQRPDSAEIMCSGENCGEHDKDTCCRARSSCLYMPECRKGYKMRKDKDLGKDLCAGALCTDEDTALCCHMLDQRSLLVHLMIWPALMILCCVVPCYMNQGTMKRFLLGPVRGSLGIIQLDRKFEAQKGDLCHAKTFDLKRLTSEVTGATWPICRKGHMPPEVRTEFEKSATYMARSGVSVVTADCGLFMWQEAVLREFTDKPVFLSALVCTKMVQTAIGVENRVAILTADAEALRAMADLVQESYGVDIRSEEKFTLIQHDDIDAMMRYVETGTTDESIRVGLMETVKEAVKANNKIRAVVIESPELRRYAFTVRAELGLPVFDASTCAEFFLEGSTDDCRIEKLRKTDPDALWHTKLTTTLRSVRQLQRTGSNEDEVDPTSSMSMLLTPLWSPPPQTSQTPAAASGKQRSHKGQAALLGVLRSDVDYEPLLGDVNHPRSFDYKVCYEGIGCLTAAMCRSGQIPEDVEKELKLSVQRLVKSNVSCITGDVTSLVGLERVLRKYTSVPLCMSSLAQLPLVMNAFPANSLIAIITANIKGLTSLHDLVKQEYDVDLGDTTRFVFVEVDDIEGFEPESVGSKTDSDLAGPGILERVRDAVQAHPGVSALLLEDTRLPPYADLLRGYTRLPVFDVLTCCNFFMNGFLAEIAHAGHQPAAQPAQPPPEASEGGEALVADGVLIPEPGSGEKGKDKGKDKGKEKGKGDGKGKGNHPRSRPPAPLTTPEEA